MAKYLGNFTLPLLAWISGNVSRSYITVRYQKILFHHHLLSRRSDHPGYAERKGRSVPFPALHLHTSAMGLDDMFDDRKPKTGAADLAAAGLIASIEPFKKPRQMLPAYPDACVPHPDQDLVPVPSRNLRTYRN